MSAPSASGGVLEAARVAYASGFSVVPPREDGTKMPLSEWAKFQKERPAPEQMRAWYADGRRSGVGAVLGAVSGNVEMFDFDDHAAYVAFKDAAQGAGIWDLVQRIEAGYAEKTPSGGVHWYYRCPTVSGNTKLARRPKRPDEMKHAGDKVAVLIETRGEGGYSVMAPSNGRVHPDGPYVLLRGGPETVVTITPEEREELWALARSFDQMPRSVVTYRVEQEAGWVVRPGDDFAAKAEWSEILEPQGWRVAFTKGDTAYWRRPGKDRGWSATTNHGGHDLLYVFSTSTEFDDERGYGKFPAYAILNHGGDFKAAAKALHDKGYGEKATTGTAVAELLDAVPAFPLEALPVPFRRLVEEVAAAMPCPPDFAATPLLIAAGAAIGDALELRIKDGWREGPNLYGGVVGDPGSKKTPSQEMAVRPMHRIQGKYDRAYAEELAEFERESALWDDAKKGERGTKPTPPAYHHVLTTDSTTEALAPMLLGSKGILLVKDELAGWIKSMDAYRAGGKGADRQHYLSMWSRSAIKVDRKSRPAPIYVPRPVLAVLGGIQPDLLGDLADSAGREDGFVDRLLFSYPDPVRDRWTDASVKQATEIAVLKIFEALHGLKPTEGPHGEHQPWTIRLGVGAAAMWRDWYESHATEMGAPSFPANLRGPWAKMPGQLARLALIVHTVDAAARNEDPDDELGETTLAAAADLVDYYKAHARRAHRRINRAKAGRDLALVILAALRQGGPTTQDQIRSGMFNRNVDADQLRTSLESLEEAGLVARETGETESGLGRKPTVWRAL